MRSTTSPAKPDKKTKKVTDKNAIPRKKKQISDLKPPIRDTISETISFVIKGKLTPIKPILVDNKLNMLKRTRKRPEAAQKVVKKDKQTVEKKVKPESSKVKTKVQTKTAKKPSAQSSAQRKSKILIDVIQQTPKTIRRKNVKPDTSVKGIKKPLVKESKPRKIKSKDINVVTVPKQKKVTIKKNKNAGNNVQETARTERVGNVNIEDGNQEKQLDELAKSKLPTNVKGKKVTVVKTTKEKSIKLKSIKPKPAKQDQHVSDNPVELPVIEPPVVVKTELPSPSLSEEIPPVPPEIPQDVVKIKIEPEDKDVIIKQEKEPSKKKTYKKLKVQPKLQIIKKRVKSKDPDKTTTKLFGFWNGPKRHRVASLNALAKVQCLYENEGKGNLLDLMEEQSRLEYMAKRESLKLAQMAAAAAEAKKEPAKSSRESTPSPTPTPRTLRSVPGLRAVGKHWDFPTDTSSSDEGELPVTKQIKQEKIEERNGDEGEKQLGEKKKRRVNRSELVMDLKDMVVRKRMASLNATAILAASYSTEKRQSSKTSKIGDFSSEDSGSSEEYFAAIARKDIKEEREEEGKKDLIEVHASPNKKVSVILNQDSGGGDRDGSSGGTTADVTITGVYVNSTTRSTRHEGYCSIAGMQYRISATGHTQTAAAAAVATAETLLRSGEAAAASATATQQQTQQDNTPVVVIDSPTASTSAPSCNGTSCTGSTPVGGNKSYAPLDALSSMQPPSAPPGVHHHHHHHQHMVGTGSHPPPVQHIVHATHQLSPVGLRHGCSSAFSSPHSTPGYHPTIQGDSGYIHAGYYQPAGPLITVGPGGGAQQSQQPPLIQPPLIKSVPLSDSSPISTTPSTSAHDVTLQSTNPVGGGAGGGAGSTNGDSSDSEVIITSVTSACGNSGTGSSKDPPPVGFPPSHHPPPPPPTYRYHATTAQYPAPHPGYPYSYPAATAYHHYAPPPAQYGAAPPQHELCYSPTTGPTYATAVHKYQYRRYIGTHQYYGGAGDVYAPPPPPVPPSVVATAGQQTQQVVTSLPSGGTSTLSATASSAAYVSGSAAVAAGGGGPPPPSLMDSYTTTTGPPHQAALVEAYQPAPAQHYYTYGPPPPPPCYTHSPAAASRAIPYINAATAATYQSCPCPIQSCPKNGHAGPLTGADGKRSSSTVSATSAAMKQQQQQSSTSSTVPLPPVALALPLEPASAHGPPSPARGSAGMPPPPSPAGATYHQPPLSQETPPKQLPPPSVDGVCIGGEVEQTPPKREEPMLAAVPKDNTAVGTEQEGKEKKRKARIGKAMVRNNIMQQNTMLLMCNPQQNFVKREIESPKEKEVTEEKKEPACPCPLQPENNKSTTQQVTAPCVEPEEITKKTTTLIEPKEEISELENNNNTITSTRVLPTVVVEELPLPPVVSTVAENVKMKNMKRKLSLCKDKVPEIDLAPSPKKKQKLGSYKMLIKKETNTVKIHNGKRKLIEEAASVQNQRPKLKVGIARRRKLSLIKNGASKRTKLSKPLTNHNGRLKKTEVILPATAKKSSLKKQNAKSATVAQSIVLNRNSIDRTIECVISEVCHTRTSSSTTTTTTTTSSSSSTSVERGSNSRTTSVERSSSRTTSADRITKKTAVQGKLKETKTAKEVTKEAKEVKTRKKEVKTGKPGRCKKITASVAAKKKQSKSLEVVEPQIVSRIPRRSLQGPRWSNGWSWEGDPYEAKVFINSDEVTAIRRCYPAMRHMEGDKIVPRDCVLLKAGPRKNDLPFVAKIAALWENPEDGEMMMSLLWYYRPEHTEQGRLPTDQPDEVFASRHKDSNSVACIDDKCYVLTFNEYCRYRKRYKRLEEGIEETLPCIPNPEPYPRSHRQPPSSDISPEMVFFCRRVYDFRQKRIVKNPT